MKKGERKQFCKYGHDTFICGRNRGGVCIACKKNIYYIPHPQQPKQFCPKGHDKFITGQYSDGDCVQCAVEHNKDYYDNHKETEAIRIGKWRKENSEKIRKDTKIYRQLNRNLCRERNRRWRIEHPDVAKAHDLKCQEQRGLRIVLWTDWDNINKIVKNCPKNKEIDHIIPLRSKKVSGLHVSWNLQYLAPLKNQKKGNKVNLLRVSEEYGNILKEIGLK